MAGENLVKVLQIAGAALGIPAAAAGTFAAYQSYFSTDVTCQKLRSSIVATLERSVAVETKRSLLRKDVAEFDKVCGEGDPDAKAIFHAVLDDTHHAAAETPRAADAGPAPAAAAVAAPPSSQVVPALPVFGAPGSREHYGWVALGRRRGPGCRISPAMRSRRRRCRRRHGVDVAAPAAGVVGAAGGQNDDESAEPAAAGRLRAGARRAVAAAGCGPRSLRHRARES